MKIRCPFCKHEWESKSKSGYLVCAYCKKSIDREKYKLMIKKK